MKRWMATALALTLCAGVMAGCRKMDNQHTTPAVTTPMVSTTAPTTPAPTTTATQPMTTPAASTPGATAGENGMVPQDSQGGGESAPDESRSANRGRFRSRMD